MSLSIIKVVSIFAILGQANANNISFCEEPNPYIITMLDMECSTFVDTKNCSSCEYVECNYCYDMACDGVYVNLYPSIYFEIRL